MSAHGGRNSSIEKREKYNKYSQQVYEPFITNTNSLDIAKLGDQYLTNHKPRKGLEILVYKTTWFMQDIFWMITLA